MIRFPASKAMSALSLAYAGYSLVRPSNLGRALEARPESAYDTTARLYGVRDLMSAGIPLVTDNKTAVTAAMVSRVAYDLGDCLILRPEARTDSAKRKVTAITLGWAGLNAAGYLLDRALLRKSGR